MACADFLPPCFDFDRAITCFPFCSSLRYTTSCCPFLDGVDSPVPGAPDVHLQKLTELVSCFPLRALHPQACRNGAKLRCFRHGPRISTLQNSNAALAVSREYGLKFALSFLFEISRAPILLYTCPGFHLRQCHNIYI